MPRRSLGPPAPPVGQPASQLRDGLHAPGSFGHAVTQRGGARPGGRAVRSSGRTRRARRGRSPATGRGAVPAAPRPPGGPGAGPGRRGCRSRSPGASATGRETSKAAGSLPALRVAIDRRRDRRDLGAARDDHPAHHRRVAVRPPGVGVHHGRPAVHLLDRTRDEGRVGGDRPPLVGVPGQRHQGRGHQLGRRLVAGEDELGVAGDDLLLGHGGGEVGEHHPGDQVVARAVGPAAGHGLGHVAAQGDRGLPAGLPVGLLLRGGIGDVGATGGPDRIAPGAELLVHPGLDAEHPGDDQRGDPAGHGGDRVDAPPRRAAARRTGRPGRPRPPRRAAATAAPRRARSPEPRCRACRRAAAGCRSPPWSGRRRSA